MKPLVLAALVALAALPAQASSLYDLRGVAKLLASVPAISSELVQGRRVYTVKGASSGGFVWPDTIDDGYLANGQEVLIVPLLSGGTGGVYTTLLWTRLDGAWKFVGYIPSDGHLLVTLQGGKINVVRPIYKASDARCCPSKRSVEVDTLDGIVLRLIERFETT